MPEDSAAWIYIVLDQSGPRYNVLDQSTARYPVTDSSGPRYIPNDQGGARYAVQELGDPKLVLIQTFGEGFNTWFSSTRPGFLWSSTHHLMSGGYVD